MQADENNIKRIINTVSHIETAISKYMVGQKDLIRKVLIAVFAGGNVLLEGVPGLGKTRLVKTLGIILGLEFKRIQFTPDLMPADIIGTNIISRDEKGSSIFTFQKGPVFANIVLADEINRATPKTQSALLEAMQERTVTAGNITYSLPNPFFVLATQNPIEMEGTYPLPEAQLDRFLFKLNTPFPSFSELCDIVTMTFSEHEVATSKILNAEEISSIRLTLNQIPIARPVLEYAVKLVSGTHPGSEFASGNINKYVRFGSSPRGAQAVVAAAKVRAALEGRFNVSYEDIKYVSVPSLCHRIFLNFEAMTDNASPNDIINELLDILPR